MMANVSWRPIDIVKRGHQTQTCRWCSTAILTLLTTSLILMGVACTPEDILPIMTPAPTPTPVKIEVQEGQETKGVPTQETLKANNCKGEAPMETVLPASRLYTRELEINPEPGVELVLGRVRTEIFDHHKVENPLDSLAATCSVPVSVPARSLYVYQIDWTPTWHEGTVEVGEPDGSPEATYRLLESLSCEVVGSQPEPCPTE